MKVKGNNIIPAKKIVGYKLNGYNATFEETTFLISKHRVDNGYTFEITDVNSSITFLFNTNESEE